VAARTRKRSHKEREDSNGGRKGRSNRYRLHSPALDLVASLIGMLDENAPTT
jgi:hypothetical protein